MKQIRLGSLFLGSAFATSLLAACSVEDSTASKKMEVRTIHTEAGEITTLVPVGRPSAIEKIIGENDLTPVINDGANIPEKYRAIINAFGRMSMGCTATHIGDGLVLSAGHCFDAPPTRSSRNDCSETKVEWGMRKDKAPYLTSTCVKILAYETNDDRDYVIYQVDTVPPVKVEVDLSTRVRDETAITIFGHPQLRPLEWSKSCVVKPGSMGNWGKDQFAHQCDTEPGNSGSTVLEEGSLKVIGIHDGGMSPWNYGTYLYDTPLAEILGKKPDPTPTIAPTAAPTAVPTVQPTAVPTPGQRPDIRITDLGDNENRVLVTFSRDEGRTASFTVEADTEADYDVVLVQSGTGFGYRSFRVSGDTSRAFRDLRTPVRVRFVSDDEITSRSVTIRDIEVK